MTGLVLLIKIILGQGFSYVLPENSQSDLLKRERKIYRQSLGECYLLDIFAGNIKLPTTIDKVGICFRVVLLMQ